MAENFVHVNPSKSRALISGKVFGDQVERGLKALGPKVENRLVNRALKKELDKLTADIRSRTPDETGELVDSISLKRKFKKKDGVVLFDIASRGPVSRIAHLVEWGRDEWTGRQRFKRTGETREVTLASTRPGARMFSRAWDSRGPHIVPKANANIRIFVGREFKKIERRAKRSAAG